MNNLIILGTVGLDDVKTPFGDVKGVLGGSGAYAAAAASYFVQPALVSIAGEDFPNNYSTLLKTRRIDLAGVQFVNKTFHWQGEYEFDMNEAKTIQTDLNSLADFKPVVPKEYQNAKYLFLGNIDPEIQLEVLGQMESKPFDSAHGRPFVVLDTMNYWITSKREKLEEVIKKTDILVMNEGEARQFCETPNLILAGKKLLELGPEYIIIKKGEHGALLFGMETFFSAPGYPLEDIKDPTGAGDSFAGGLIGYLAQTDDTSEANIRKAIIHGSVIASFCAEDFSLDYLKKITNKEIEERYSVFEKIRKF